MTKVNENSPFPGGGRFWVGETWGSVIEYYAKNTAAEPTDGHAYISEGRIVICHIGGRNDPTLRQKIPKCLERYTIAKFKEHGGKIETQRRNRPVYRMDEPPAVIDLDSFFDGKAQDGRTKDALNWIETGGAFGWQRRFPFYTVKRLQNGAYQATRDGDNKPQAQSQSLDTLAQMIAPYIRQKIGEWEYCPTERTSAGLQYVAPCVEPVAPVDRLTERQQGRMAPKKPQRRADHGLFDLSARTQQEMF